MEEKRINDKIKELYITLEELTSLFPINYEDYITDFKIRAICEHYFEKISEIIIDITFLIIKNVKLEIPEDDRSSFKILAKNRIISFELADKLRSARGMRNVIAHEYGEINNEKIYYSVTEELPNDVEEFIKSIDIFIKSYKEEEAKDEHEKEN